MKRVAFTVDAEQDAPPLCSSWQGMQAGMRLLLSLLDAHEVVATIFVTGDAASRFPETVTEAGRIHEIGCHGLDHARFDRMSPTEQGKQVLEATEILRRVTGKQPRGFRAPNFQYTRDTLRIVRDAGYLYDASRALYHLKPCTERTGLPQIANTFPSSVLRLPWPMAGPLLRASLSMFPLVVLDFHPWELVPISGLRPDISYATGDKAIDRLDHAFHEMKSWGAQFVTLESVIQDNAIS